MQNRLFRVNAPLPDSTSTNSLTGAADNGGPNPTGSPPVAAAPGPAVGKPAA
jgi:hypothetical protein